MWRMTWNLIFDMTWHDTHDTHWHLSFIFTDDGFCGYRSNLSSISQWVAIWIKEMLAHIKRNGVLFRFGQVSKKHLSISSGSKQCCAGLNEKCQFKKRREQNPILKREQMLKCFWDLACSENSVSRGRGQNNNKSNEKWKRKKVNF